LHIVKDDSISSYPNHPTGCDANFSENAVIKGFPCLQDHIQRSSIQVLDDWDSGPAIPTERTFKEQVEAGFFTVQVA